MNEKFTNELDALISYIYPPEWNNIDEKELVKVYDKYFSGNLSGISILEDNFYTEFKNNLYENINSNDARKAYINELIRRFNRSSFIEQNKDLITEIWNDSKNFEKQPIYNKLLLRIIFVLHDLSGFIEVTSMTFGFIKTDLEPKQSFDFMGSFKNFPFLAKNTKDMQEPEQPKGKRTPVTEKPFHEYILHEKNVQIAEQLKSEFKTEKGKSIRLIIEVLIKKKMLTIENRQRQKIYDAMKIHFNRDIGTKQSIFDYKIKEISDRPDFESIEIRIDKRLSGINKTK